MRKYIKYVVSYFLCGVISTYAVAEVIDPEKYIEMNGYHSAKMGDDGKTRFYIFTERAPLSRIIELENEIDKLSKRVEVQKVCDFMRGATKAKLIEKRGSVIDVALTNYGYKRSTVVCVFKYMHESNVGSQIVYNKKGAGGMYMVFVTE